MGLFGSSILVKYSLLNNSGSLVYAGNSSNSLRLWGAQLELAEFSEDILNDYINNYRYTRTTGIEHNFIGLRFGSGAGGDPADDGVLIGLGQAFKTAGGSLENVPFFINKAPVRSIDSFTGNQLLYSEQFNQPSSWLTSNSAIFANATTAPDGQPTADKLVVYNTSNTTHQLSQYTPAIQNRTATFSVYAKAAEFSRIMIQQSNFINSAAQAYFDLTTGSVISSTVINTTPLLIGPDYINLQANIQNVGQGWFRCSLTATKLSNTNSSVCDIQLVSSTATTSNFTALSGFSPTVYNTQSVGGWGTFMNTYGVWIDTGLSSSNSGRFYTYYRNFNAPYTGYYNVYFAADDNGSFYIDDSLLVSVPRGAEPPYAYNIANAPGNIIWLTAGPHTITMTALNNFDGIPTSWVSNPGGWAATINNATSNVVLWDTRTYAAGENYQTVSLRNSGVYVWGAQLETETFPSYYVQTTSAPVYSAVRTASGPDNILAGQLSGLREHSNSLENVKFNITQRIKDTPGFDGTGVTVSDDRRRIPSNPVYDAAKVAGLELVKKTAQTFSYNTYTPVTGDNVYYNANDWFSEVGRSQRARMAIGGDTEVFFFDKRLDETKQIPQNPRFDALRVMGIEPVYKTSSIVNLAKYTPLRSADVTYYKRYDWYSMVPRSQYAKLAYGIGDGSPYIYDNMLISGDHFEYSTDKHFDDFLTLGYGSTSQTSRLAGRNEPEVMSFVILQNIKRGAHRIITIDNSNFNTSNLAQIQEIFYNQPGNVFGKNWYQLTPYYNSYGHIIDSAGGWDNIRVGAQQPGIRYAGDVFETFAVTFSPATRNDQLTAPDSFGRVYNKRATIGDYNTSTLQSVVRTNRVLYSERLDRSLWSTSGISVLQTSVLLSASLPYRNVSYDANQIQEMFTNKAYTYAPRKWYTIVPLATRTSFTSTGISLITLSSSNSQHFTQTAVEVQSENYFSAGMYVRSRTGVRKVRLFAGPAADSSYDLLPTSGSYDLLGSPSLPFDTDLMGSGITDPHYADFDLSSVTVTTSVNVTQANIVPQGDNWYLIKILGPIRGQALSSYFTRVLTDTASIYDTITLDSSLFYIAPSDLLTTSGSIDLLTVGSTTNEDLNTTDISTSLDMDSYGGSADLMIATSLEFPADLL